MNKELFAASPSDVRKGLALPASRMESGAAPRVGRSPNHKEWLTVGHSHHRTSDGIAEEGRFIRYFLTWQRVAQLMLVLFCALTLKRYYSTASANELRWILAPTTFLVELITGSGFEFESYAGYINGDRSFVIAPSCAGVNFLITAFLMLSLRKLWTAHAQNQSVNVAWRFIPVAALFAYLVTLVANTVRISTALRLQRAQLEIGWLTRDQIHRFEGILIYFGFLLLLYIIGEKISYRTASVNDRRSPTAESFSSLLRQCCLPLLIYYATTLGLPLANGAYQQGLDFWEHSVFVLLIPLLVILSLATLRFYRNQVRGRI